MNISRQIEQVMAQLNKIKDKLSEKEDRNFQIAGEGWVVITWGKRGKKVILAKISPFTVSEDERLVYERFMRDDFREKPDGPKP